MEALEPLNMEHSNFSFPQPYPPQASVASSSSAQPHVPTSSPVSAGAGPSAPLQLPSSSAPPPSCLMYKNRLQEYTQRASLPLPQYQTVNVGFQHAPKFRSTVWVDGMSFTSQNTFPHRKAAEQDVAKIAFEGICKKIRDEGCPLILQNTMFCKSILNEYAVKLNLERPTYNTVQKKGLLPVFVSSLVFNGIRYTGDAARNKREAEQLAARAVIVTIMGTSESGTILCEIIKSKSKFYAAINNGKDSPCIHAGTVLPTTNTGHTSDALDHQEKEVAASMTANNQETVAALPKSSRILPSCQESHMPEQEPSPEATKRPNVSVQPGPEQPIDDGPSLKKRRKNKKRAKKSQSGSPLPVAAFPSNPIPPCSVTQ